jgi:S-adenosylmethionine decarboxylase
MNGLHILAEFHDCQGSRPCCWRPTRWLRCAGAPASRPAWKSSPRPSTSFPGAGATGALVLAESHLAVHTWPELDAVTLDLYVCNHSRDNRAAAEAAFAALKQAFLPQHVVRRDVMRGETGVAAPALTD